MLRRLSRLVTFFLFLISKLSLGLIFLFNEVFLVFAFFFFLFFKILQSFYLYSNWLTYSIVLVSGIEFSDSSLTDNTQYSSQQVPSSVLTPHLAHLPPSTLSLFSIIKSLLWFVSLSLLPPPPSYVCFSSASKRPTPNRCLPVRCRGLRTPLSLRDS